jgi:MYXO-CTERM domain-containing protein
MTLSGGCSASPRSSSSSSGLAWLALALGGLVIARRRR